jgi:hypothetical protein
MRQVDIEELTKPYTAPRGALDRRFEAAVKADVPSASELFQEIFQDLDTNTFGIRWWSLVQREERILISDYLYQCAEGIEKNLVEAKLHYMEWIDARETINERIIDGIKLSPHGAPFFKHPPSLAPIDDLPNKLDELHRAGFFRAIGSSLDCLGAVVIGVLGLQTSLRHSSIDSARRTLSKIEDLGTAKTKLQIEFGNFLEQSIKSSGPEDWLEWADQYRNMFVHRGRRLTYNQVFPTVPPFYSAGAWRTKASSNVHLAKYPDKSDAEAFIKVDMVLNEPADSSLRGVFDSTRRLEHSICSRLLSIWRERRNDPSLIEQPETQWTNKRLRACTFQGYDTNVEPLNVSEMSSSGAPLRRLVAAAADDGNRDRVWAGSIWAQ